MLGMQCGEGVKSAEIAVLDRLRNIMKVGVGSLNVACTTFNDAPPDRIAVERGAAWPILHETPDSAVAFAWLHPLLATNAEPDEAVIVDLAGHRRSAYGGLLWYATFQAIRASDRVLLDTEAESSVRQIDALRTEIDAGIAALDAGALPATKGDVIAGLAWNCMALFAGGELLHDDRLMRTALRASRAVVSRQQSAGGYLQASKSDNPETFWFHELQIAHAIASIGLQAADMEIKLSAVRAALFHMNETQPDHATNQPWGLSAFLIDPQTHLMAEGLIHAAAVEQPERLSGVSLILLADALYSWRRR